jgi:hypothetical protein
MAPLPVYIQGELGEEVSGEERDKVKGPVNMFDWHDSIFLLGNLPK